MFRFEFWKILIFKELLEEESEMKRIVRIYFIFEYYVIFEVFLRYYFVLLGKVILLIGIIDIVYYFILEG